jgi:hypothetical protein
MTTTNNTTRPRKSLADQIQRLDSILDGLSEGLNEAVTTAVKEAVTTGVQQAIVEVLTNPELQQLLHPPTPPTPPPAPPTPPAETHNGGGWLGGLWLALSGTAGRVAKAATQAASAVGGWLAATAQKARDLVVGGVQKVRRGARTLYGWVLTSSLAKVVGVGGLIAAGCFMVNPALAGAVGGAALAVAAAVSQLPEYVLALLGRTASND